jgi:hypothetical protein
MILQYGTYPVYRLLLGLDMITLLASELASSDGYIVPSSVHIKRLAPLLYRDLFVVAAQESKGQLVDMVGIVLDTQALVEWVYTPLEQLPVLEHLKSALVLLELEIRLPCSVLKQVKIY